MLNIPTEQHRKFLEYTSDYFKKNNVRGLLKGSLVNGHATKFSDIDLVIMEVEQNVIKDFISNYVSVALLSVTERPKGILIVIYENGICLDLDVRKKIQHEEYQEGFILGDEFRQEDISSKIVRCESVTIPFFDKADEWSNMQRLFHRSLIKWLGGKEELGYSILMEIRDFLNQQGINTGSLSGAYKEEFDCVYNTFSDHYIFPKGFKNILDSLMSEL